MSGKLIGVAVTPKATKTKKRQAVDIDGAKRKLTYGGKEIIAGQ
ncbi:hypothetical protein TNCV_346371, partial [Trichonephila clavipes]